MEKFCPNFSMHKKALTCQMRIRARGVYRKRLRSAREYALAHSFYGLAMPIFKGRRIGDKNEK